MTTAPLAQVAAVVLAAQGGPRLARTLGGLPCPVVLLDPAERCPSATLPPGVRRVRETAALADVEVPWLLLLHEDERVGPALAAALARATTSGRAIGAYRIPLEVHAFGGRLRPRGAPLRLGRRDGATVTVARGMQLGWKVHDGAAPVLDAPIVVEPAHPLSDAVANLDADAAALAALLFEAGRHPRLGRMLLSPLAAGGRVAMGRAIVANGWGRWILSVFAGYRAIVTYAKLWELRRAQVSVPA